MPRIFDNIDLPLLPSLRQTLEVSDRADFCVGYLNLRGWKLLAPLVENWPGGDGHCCRLLVGMHRPPDQELRAALSPTNAEDDIDNQSAMRTKKEMAKSFADQLAVGSPTNEDEAGLRRFAKQLRNKKVVVKLFLRHPLHAKLYLLFRKDPNNPITGYLGSSNLTMAGLRHQGELNVDVLDHDACNKLQKWFNDRWDDRWCMDISDELAAIIEESWAREKVPPPYHLYVKIAYHLSHEAREGLAEFKIPADFNNKLFEFQKKAVKIAARHLNKRGGVLIGDVVGLGKTLMATALARIFEDDFGLETLILCPKNLVRMWEDYRERYRMRGRVLSMSRVGQELGNLRRYRLVLIDESHNLRNREGKRYRVIQEYIKANECRCILLSATPYNKSYLDLAHQLRLFVSEDSSLPIRPEQLLQQLGGETEFITRYQCGIRTLAAFEKSSYPDDWREIMRLFFIRRTRGFIQQHYAVADDVNGRKYLKFEDGSRSYFPTRVPRTVAFNLDDKNPTDQYSRLYDESVVDAIEKLTLPRYGLGNYLSPSPDEPPTQPEARTIQDLSRAGKRLKGFCRTNLFKRLESSGQAFLQSVERHILRNCVFLYALANGQELPIGTQEANLLDLHTDNEDTLITTEEEDEGEETVASKATSLRTEADFLARAKAIYQEYAGSFKKRFKWIRPALFVKELTRDLRKDNKALLGVLQRCGDWNPSKDSKLNALHELLTIKHPGEKVLIFSQFADTVHYLEARLRERGITRLAAATGGSSDPTTLAYRFSPVSNDRRKDVTPDRELSVLLATDILSEGQNLQDCSVVVNYDLPWAIIRLVQRAGRVDRIGQKAENILCYSFLPAEGVERIIRLRTRVRQRLKENAEVVGTDEAFFEDDGEGQTVLDLYHEKAGILDDADGEVDLISEAFQIWDNAIKADPSLKQTIEDMPKVVYSTKAYTPRPGLPPGVLVYLRSPEGNDALAWMNGEGQSVTESQSTILRAAACTPDTPALPRAENHHQLVEKAVALISAEEKAIGGSLGRPSGARFRTYERLKRYADSVKGTLFESKTLEKTLQDIYRYPLRPTAVDTLNRQLRSGIADVDLATLVVALREEDRLCIVEEDQQRKDTTIICSMGLTGPG